MSKTRIQGRPGGSRKTHPWYYNVSSLRMIVEITSLAGIYEAGLIY